MVKRRRSSPRRKTRKLHCWTGYERVPGTKVGAKGSCRKIGSGPRRRKSSRRRRKSSRRRRKSSRRRRKSSSYYKYSRHHKGSNMRSNKRRRSRKRSTRRRRKKKKIKNKGGLERWLKKSSARSKKRHSKSIPRNRAYYRPTRQGAGMTKAGVAAYRRANPGSKLRTAVTGNPKKGSKSYNRRKSYCARSKGQWRRSSAKTRNDPNSRINQARRRWKCRN
jgi:hypothetical protein